VIKLTAITKTYVAGKSTVEALKGLDFEISAGELMVIRGPSGSGKSTMLNIVGLLDAPTGGVVELDGKRVTYEDFDSLATIRSRTISFVFQSFNLNPVLTAEENVMVPLMVRDDIEKSEKWRRAAEWIEKVGLATHRNHRPDELSGGQRQRVAIARAMVSQPKLVIGDEPTANLDSKTARNLLGLMKDLNRERRTAFLFATHDPIFDDFSTRTALLQDGKLTEATARR